MTSVVVSSTSAITLIGQTQQFNVQVKGTGSFSPDVTWLVNGIVGGNASIGSISTTGLYTAPVVVPVSNSVTIKAVSVQTPAISGAVQDTIVSGITSISMTPVSTVMPGGQKQQFQVTIGGVANQAASWSVAPQSVSLSNVGTISAAGLYTSPNNLAAPVVFNITATSVLDPAAHATGSVTVFPQPVITQIDPATADAGDTLRIFGTNLDFIRTVNFAGPNQTLIESPAQGSDIIQVVVPVSAGSGPVFLTWQVPGFPAVSTNSLAFTRLPRLRIRADSQDLSPGETTQIRFRVFGQSGAQTVDWSAEVGSIDPSGMYQAPGSVGADSFVHVKGCISGTLSCDSQMLGLHPFRIAPTQPMVPLGGTLQLNAISGGSPIGATWAQLSGQGTLSPAGLYTASNAVADAGSAEVTAAFSGSTESVSIGVSGGFPGLITRVHDYMDFTGFSPFGTVDQSIAVSGNRAYVAATNLPTGFIQTRFWIDVYDITDPAHPVWVDAVEAAAHGNLFVHGNFLFQITTRDDAQGFISTPSVIAIFDISGPTPLLVTRKIVPQMFTFNFADGIVAAAPDGIFFPVPVGTFYVFDLRSGTISEKDLLLQVNGQPVQAASGVVANGRLYTVSPGFPPFQLSVFDLATNPPAFQGSVLVPGNPGVKVEGNLLFAGDNIYDISGTLPVQVGSLPGLNFRSTNGALALSDTFQGGPRVADISDPAHPRFLSVVGQAGISLAGHNAAWSGNLLYFAEEAGGLAVYDASLPGGPVEQAFLPGTGGTNSFATIALDQVASATNLFVATDTNSGGVVNSYDLTVNPAVRIGKFETGVAAPEALNLNGNTLYVGTDTSPALLVFDASNPAALSLGSSLPLGPVTALARSGNSLYVATLDQHLLVFDVSQPGSPVQVLTLLLPDVADHMTVSGNLLLVANDAAGLGIYSIAAPANPLLLAQMNLGAEVADVAVDGSLALLAAADAGLVIVDISNPAAPLEVSRTALDMPQVYGGGILRNLAASVAFKDSVAYLGTVLNNDLLFAFDYRHPAHPRLISLAAYVFSISGGIGLEGAILTQHITGSSLFMGGVFELTTPVIQADISQPGNVINFYLLPAALLPPPGIVSVQPKIPISQNKLQKSPFQWRRGLHDQLRKLQGFSPGSDNSKSFNTEEKE